MAEIYWIRTPEMTDIFTEGYVGMTTKSTAHRWAAHQKTAKVPSKAHLPIYRAISKYGPENLIVSVIVVGPIEFIQDLEEKLRPETGVGWNVAIGGQATGKGRKHSEEWKEATRQRMKLFRHSEESKAKMSKHSKGRPKSAEHRIKCGLANKGKRRSQQAKDKQRIAMTGFRHSDETKQRMVEYQATRPPWARSRSNKQVWLRAGELYLLGSEAFRSYATVAQILGVKKSSATAIVEKFKSGWNPLEDVLWLSFKETYMEAHNANTQPS